MNDLWERATELWYRLTPRPSIPVDDVIAILQNVNQIAARRIKELDDDKERLRAQVLIEQAMRHAMENTLRRETRSNADQ